MLHRGVQAGVGKTSGLMDCWGFTSFTMLRRSLQRSISASAFSPVSDHDNSVLVKVFVQEVNFGVVWRSRDMRILIASSFSQHGDFLQVPAAPPGIAHGTELPWCPGHRRSFANQTRQNVHRKSRSSCPYCSACKLEADRLMVLGCEANIEWETLCGARFLFGHIRPPNYFSYVIMSIPLYFIFQKMQPPI